MKLAAISQTGALSPFVARLHFFEAGNRCLEWGEGNKPARIQLHFSNPPPLEELPDGLVKLAQAFISTKNRNLVVASKYCAPLDRDWLLAFCLHLPSGYRGKPVTNRATNRPIACDHPTPHKNGKDFDLTGFLFLREGQEARMDTLNLDGRPSHIEIKINPGSRDPQVVVRDGFQRPQEDSAAHTQAQYVEDRPLFKSIPRLLPAKPAA